MNLYDTVAAIREKLAIARQSVRDARTLARELPSGCFSGKAWGEAKQRVDAALEDAAQAISDEGYGAVAGMGWGRDEGEPVITQPTPHTSTGALIQYEPPSGDEYGERAMEGECAEVAAAKPGGRNSQLARSSFKLGQLVGAGLLNEDSARKELLRAARECGIHARESESTVSSGITAGKRKPRLVR